MEHLTGKQIALIIVILLAVYASCQTIFFIIPHYASGGSPEENAVTPTVRSEKGTATPGRTPTSTPKPTAQATVKPKLTSTPIPTPTPKPTATPKPKKQHELVEEFGCRWIMDTYRPMTDLGRDMAILHLSNEMTMKRGMSAFSYVGTGDAAEALRECER